MKCIRKVEERLFEGHYAYRIHYYLGKELVCDIIENPEEYVSAVGLSPEAVKEIEKANEFCRLVIKELEKKFKYC
ncbi:MAG: hypothetical protein F7C82_05795 [Desulfurococcales archaeon]|nr:hypothetical protein [Desulfurococcales archaeon]